MSKLNILWLSPTNIGIQIKKRTVTYMTGNSFCSQQNCSTKTDRQGAKANTTTEKLKRWLEHFMFCHSFDRGRNFIEVRQTSEFTLLERAFNQQVVFLEKLKLINSPEIPSSHRRGTRRLFGRPDNKVQNRKVTMNQGLLY